VGGRALNAPRPILLDTCAAIWLAEGDPMSPESRAAIAAARAASDGVFVSPITAWEVGLLAARNRIRLTMPPEDWFAALTALPGIRLAPMSPAILIASSFLPGEPPRDPADRIIAATARAFGQTLITRDGELLPYAEAGYLAAINC
jgi:PIN domain nuclease of toxin-antitoxin system